MRVLDGGLDPPTEGRSPGRLVLTYLQC